MLLQSINQSIDQTNNQSTISRFLHSTAAHYENTMQPLTCSYSLNNRERVTHLLNNIITNYKYPVYHEQGIQNSNYYKITLNKAICNSKKKKKRNQAPTVKVASVDFPSSCAKMFSSISIDLGRTGQLSFQSFPFIRNKGSTKSSKAFLVSLNNLFFFFSL